MGKGIKIAMGICISALGVLGAKTLYDSGYGNGYEAASRKFNPERIVVTRNPDGDFRSAYSSNRDGTSSREFFYAEESENGDIIFGK